MTQNPERVPLTKAAARMLLECDTDRELAQALRITPAAVYQWTDPIPRVAEDKVLAEAYRRHQGAEVRPDAKPTA